VLANETLIAHHGDSRLLSGAANKALFGPRSGPILADSSLLLFAPRISMEMLVGSQILVAGLANGIHAIRRDAFVL